MVLADQILTFYKSLKLEMPLPKGVDVLNPFRHDDVFELCKKFYHEFYNDSNPRRLIMGINPGRLGGGTTGIPFTDPVKLEKFCSIPNPLPKKTELSADFIYTMIEAFGGVNSFYKRFHFSSVCPLGFTMDGKNLNYYDLPKLEQAVRPFIISSIRKQLTFPIDTGTCFCLGEGENYKYLLKLNQEFSFFENIVPLPHPRFIMQYRRKKVHEYVNVYIQKLNIH